MSDKGRLATFFFTGGFAEYVIVSSSCAVDLPETMPLDCASLIGCAVMTGAGAAMNIAKVKPGETVLVIGCGAVGLAAVQGAGLCGASRAQTVVLCVRPIWAAGSHPQYRSNAYHVLAQGEQSNLLIVPQCNHFTILNALASQDGCLQMEAKLLISSI
jgi:hypothetical protein